VQCVFGREKEPERTMEMDRRTVTRERSLADARGRFDTDSARTAGRNARRDLTGRPPACNPNNQRATAVEVPKRRGDSLHSFVDRFESSVWMRRRQALIAIVPARQKIESIDAQSESSGWTGFGLPPLRVYFFTTAAIQLISTRDLPGSAATATVVRAGPPLGK